MTAYPWWERWGDMAAQRWNHPVRTVTAYLDHAAWFIDRYADEAESLGWRPVHVMHPKRGLAWRWRNVPTPASSLTDAALLARWHPRASNLSFAYRPMADGSLFVLTGPEREACLAVE